MSTPNPEGSRLDPLIAVSSAYAALSAADRADVRDQARAEAFRDRPGLAVRIALGSFVIVAVPGLAASVTASAILPGIPGALASGLCIGVACFAFTLLQERKRAPWLAPHVDRLAVERAQASDAEPRGD